VAWSTWLSKGITDEPESGGGLMVGAIQLSIMLGAAFGGLLLDHISIAATLIGGTILLALASLIVGNGDRIKPPGECAAVEASRGDRRFLRKIATGGARTSATRNGIDVVLR
jgi:hypothetical protein